jgi:periplasmic protein TonB
MTARAIALLEYDDGPDLTRWGLAAAIVLAAHVGLATAYLTLRSHQSQGSPEVPAIIIDLAPLPVAPTVQQQDITPGPETPPPEPDASAPPKPEPLPIVEPTPTVPPLVALPEPKPETRTEPKPIEKPPERVREDKPKPVLQTAPPRARQVAPAPGGPKLGTNSANAVPPSWISLLMAHLHRHKRYPGAAREQGAQGIVMLNFTMDRNGHVLSRRIVKSSGSSALDQEVLTMIQRAQPLPRFSPDMTGSSRTFTVPIAFSLR